MKREILVISDNFNEYSKYRSILETLFTVSLRTNYDEVSLFLDENKDIIEYVIIDIDDGLNNGIVDYINLVSLYDLPYIIVVDSSDFFDSLFYGMNFLDEDNIISRQSIYSNLVDLTVNNFDNTMGDFYYDQ